MAGHAAGVDFLGRVLFEDKNLGDVATTCDVGRAGTVTALATLVRRLRFGIECRFPVRALLPSRVNFLVTGLANLCAYVVGRLDGVRRLLRGVLFLADRRGLGGVGGFFLSACRNER